MKNLSKLAVLSVLFALATLSMGCSWLIPHDGMSNEVHRNMPGYKYDKTCTRNNLGGENTCVENETVEPGAMYGAYGYGANMVGMGGPAPALNMPKVDCYVNDRGDQCCVRPGQMCYGSEGDAFDPAGSPNYRLQRNLNAIGRQVNNLNNHAQEQDACIRSGNCADRSKKNRKQ